MTVARIEADRVRLSLRGQEIVHGATLAMEPGELTVIVGPNGAGKSTLLKLLTGEIKASSGQVTYDGVPIEAVAPWRLACRRAVMAQASRMAFPFSVHEAARLGLDGIGRALPRPRRQEIVEAALAAADVAHLAGRSLQTLSGGEQQRAHFARVLCQLRAGETLSPDQALFLDEPVSSLDLKHQLGLMDAARRLADQGKQVVAVLHDLNLAVTYADRIVVMQNGRIVASGPVGVLTRDLVFHVFGVDLLREGGPASPFPSILPQHLLSRHSDPTEQAARACKQMARS